MAVKSLSSCTHYSGVHDGHTASQVLGLGYTVPTPGGGVLGPEVDFYTGFTWLGYTVPTPGGAAGGGGSLGAGQKAGNLQYIIQLQHVSSCSSLT